MSPVEFRRTKYGVIAKRLVVKIYELYLLALSFPKTWRSGLMSNNSMTLAS